MAKTQRVLEVAKQVRELLLSLPYHNRNDALYETGLCRHCGVDELDADGKRDAMPCQCWNDE